ncbi:MAG: hypothetical protein IIV16_03625 [Alistipes sp.]|nr:hypothetical protein [Alistipes sp.]
MKKILAILTVLFATSVATSCVKPYENTEPLTIDNYDLTVPKAASKKDLNGENIHYFQITATGPWEATLTQQVDGEVWCWLRDYYAKAKKDEYGNSIKDEYGRYEYDKIYIAEGVEYFNGTDKFCKVRGKAGTTFLPMEYQDNQGVVRYALLHVRRTDIDCEKWVNITQNK